MNRTRTFAVALLSILIGLSALAQQPPRFEPPANPKRYWIVVDKTAAARPFSEAIRQTVFDLVYQGAGGEMVDGSVFEIWIYGDDTAVRGFTPEMLMPDNHRVVAQKATSYIRRFPEQGAGDMPEFAEHVRDMASVVFETTIFFVSAPTTRLNGTTVDDEVNAVFDAHGKRMVQEGKPFITTFRVQDGKLADYSVSESALALAIPPMPTTKFSESEKARMIAEARAAIDAKETARLKVIAAETKARMEAEEEAKRLARLEREKPDDEREGAIILRGTPAKENVTQPEQTDITDTRSTSQPVEIVEEPLPVVDVSQEEGPGPAAAGEANVGGSEPVEIVAEGAETASNPAGEIHSAPDAATNGASASQEIADGVESGGLDAGELASTNKNNLPNSETNDLAAADSPEMDPKNFAVQPQTWFTAGGLFAAGLLFFVVAGLLVFIAIRRAKTASGPSYITQSMQKKRIDRS